MTKNGDEISLDGMVLEEDPSAEYVAGAFDGVYLATRVLTHLVPGINQGETFEYLLSAVIDAEADIEGLSETDIQALAIEVRDTITASRGMPQ